METIFCSITWFFCYDLYLPTKPTMVIIISFKNIRGSVALDVMARFIIIVLLATFVAGNDEIIASLIFTQKYCFRPAVDCSVCFYSCASPKALKFQQGSEDMSKPAMWCCVDASNTSAINIISISNEW